MAAVTYGAGALNMVNAVAAAYAEKSPVVVLSGGPGKGESASGLLLHDQAKTLDSQARMFEEITCAQARLDDAVRASAEIARVLDACLAHSRPMYLEIPRDMGDCLFTAMDMEHATLVAPGYYATMGYGAPAGLGLQASTGRRSLILVGDGAFQMTGWELGNCRRYGWDPIVPVFNNASWEMLRTFQPESGFNDLDEWDFATLARGLGGDGMRVRTRRELRDALARAVAIRGRFQLIEIMIPRGVLSPTLERSVAGVKRLTARVGLETSGAKDARESARSG